MSVQLGPTRRRGPRGGTSDFSAYNFRDGLDVKSTPQEVSDHGLTAAKDVYLRADGGVNLRNGMAAYGSPPASGQGILARFYQGVKNGTAVTPITTNLLEQIGNTLYSVTSGSNTTIGSIYNGVTNASPMTWCRIQNPNDPNFVSGLTDCIVMCTGSGGPYVYDGTNLYTPAGWSAASGAQWCDVVNGILWFGSIPAYPNQIFGAGDGITASMESLPSYRNFIFSAPVTGLKAIGTGANAILACGRNTGLTLLYGTGPSTFYAQDIPFPDGIQAGRTMVSGSGVLYFLGRMAYYSFDGTSTPQRVSKRIEPWILNDPVIAQQANQYPLTTANYAWAQLYNNRIHLGYCANSSSTPNAILCFDLELGGWTVLAPTPGLSSMCLLDAPSDPAPYQCYVASATTGQVYQWDYLGSFTNGQAPTVLDGTTPVLAIAQTKYFKVGAPGTNKTLTRAYPEFFVSATPFAIPFTFSTDYGNAMSSIIVDNAGVTSALGIWDQSLWDVALWGATGYQSFNAPESRIDVDIPFEAIAFGFQMTSALAPFVWAGMTGSFSQRGRT